MEIGVDSLHESSLTRAYSITDQSQLRKARNKIFCLHLPAMPTQTIATGFSDVMMENARQVFGVAYVADRLYLFLIGMGSKFQYNA